MAEPARDAPARRPGPERPAGIQRLSLTRWFALVVGLLLLVAAVGGVAGLVGLARLSERRALLADRLDPATTAALRLSGALLNEETGVRGYVLSQEDVFLEPYRRGRREEAAAVAQLRRLGDRPQLVDLRRDVAAVQRRADLWRARYAEPAVAAVQSGRGAPAPTAGKAEFDAVRAALAMQQRDLQAARRAARDDLDAAARFVWVVFIGGGVLILLAVVAAALALRRVVIAPIGQLADDVRTVARGEFDHTLTPAGPREIADLGRDVDAMRRRIVDEVAALRDAERALIAQAQELQRSNQELEQFAYVASHDLQEPLRKVASFTQMLERRYKGQLDERADRYIAFAVDGAKRMQELINDLLEFSRVGRLERPHAPVDCGALVREAEARLAAPLEETGATVEVGDLPVVVGDAGLLIAVFQNLLSNALKFRGDAPPHVRIETRRQGRFWHFACTDNGIGVEDEYAERIFVIFQRLHTRDVYEGTGIGLAMCRKIIEYHGGRIWLAKAEAGRGARFEFTLPAPPDPEEEPVP